MIHRTWSWPLLDQPTSSFLGSHDCTSKERFPYSRSYNTTSGSLLSVSSTVSAKPLTSPLRPVREHIFSENFICVFKRGKPPLENDNTGIHLRNHSGSSLISLLPISTLCLKTSSDTSICVFQGEKPPFKNDYTSIRLRAISQAHP